MVPGNQSYLPFSFDNMKHAYSLILELNSCVLAVAVNTKFLLPFKTNFDWDTHYTTILETQIN